MTSVLPMITTALPSTLLPPSVPQIQILSCRVQSTIYQAKGHMHPASSLDLSKR